MAKILRSHCPRSAHRPIAAALCACALMGLSSWAQAGGEAASPSTGGNLLSFSTSASQEVTRDVLTVSLQVMRDGNDANTVQTALKQVLETALNEARQEVKKSADPNALSVRSGHFNLSPRYGNNGKPNGWTGSAGVVLEGRDIAKVAATAGRLNGMTISETHYSLSRELRERYEAELTAQAIDKFRRRAAEMAKQFGYSSYTLKEVQVSNGDNDQNPMPVMMARVAVADAAPAPLPTEAGKGVLSATVQGSVTLTR